MRLKNVKISTLSYSKRINYAFDLDTLYYIFRRKLGDGVSKLRYKDHQLLYKNNACFREKKRCFTNILNISFGRNGFLRIGKNQISFSQCKNIDLSKIFLDIVNEYFTLMPSSKVYKTIKERMDIDIVNQVMKELTTISYDDNSTKINHLTIVCEYDKKIDFSTLNFPSTMTKTDALPEKYNFDRYRIGNSILYMYKTTGNVMIISNSFTEAENVLAMLRQI